jgi:hypothetical protein
MLELDPLRAYNDKELCQILGGISRTTLWHIRDNAAGPHMLESGYAYPGSRTRRTTAAQIRNYLARVEAHADSLTREREAFNLKLDEQLARHGGVRKSAA